MLRSLTPGGEKKTMPTATGSAIRDERNAHDDTTTADEAADASNKNMCREEPCRAADSVRNKTSRSG